MLSKGASKYHHKSVDVFDTEAEVIGYMDTLNFVSILSFFNFLKWTVTLISC